MAVTAQHKPASGASRTKSFEVTIRATIEARSFSSAQAKLEPLRAAVERHATWSEVHMHGRGEGR